MSYAPQVSKQHYSFKGYFHEFRWMSFWYQFKEIIPREDIKSMLDIGPGTAFTKIFLAEFRPDIAYTTLDVAEDLQPDHLGSVTNIPLADASVDAVTAFQVLEHIEFSDFEVALKEMNRVSKKYIFISLPHNVPSFDFQMKLPGLGRIKFALKFSIAQKHIFNGQHYWEVGRRGYEAKKIRKILNKHFTVLADFVPHENQYHHFYIMEKKI